jgi:hypothetical protein
MAPTPHVGSSASQVPPDRSHIATERRNPRTMDLHSLSVEACIERINIEDRHAFDAVKRARTRISTFVEARLSRSPLIASSASSPAATVRCARAVNRRKMMHRVRGANSKH